MDRGTVRGRQLVLQIGSEARTARLDRGLSLAFAARGMDRSASWMSRVERGLSTCVSVLELARMCAVVGLDLTMRTYPGSSPLRDAAHARILAAFRARLHRSIRWSGEVPLPRAGDQRAWDALIRGEGWRYGVEAETRPHDAQSTARRLLLKERDGDVDGVLLVVPDTRQARTFVEEFVAIAGSSFPVSGRAALGRLASGSDPGGNAVIILPRGSRLAAPAT